MKIKHEHIRMAMNAWAYPDGEKVPAAEIARTYFELGMTFPELYDDSHPEALARNTQKIFRWVEKDTPDAVEKIQALLCAVAAACSGSIRMTTGRYLAISERKSTHYVMDED